MTAQQKHLFALARIRCLAWIVALTCMGYASSAAALMVPVSRSELVDVPSEMGEVIVADPEIADVYVHGKNKVSIIGKSLGRTNVRIFSPQNKLIRAIDVTVGYDLPAIRKALKDLLPYEIVGVEMVNTNIALTGQISSATAADRAVKIVNEFVEPAFGKEKTAAAAGGEGVQPKVINLMTISSGQQVMLRVRVGEMKRTALKNLGVNLQAVKNGADTVFNIGTGGGLGAFTQGSGLDFGQYNIQSDSRGAISGTLLNPSGNGLSAMLEALEQDGLFKVLAEPNLVSMSGEEAQFLAGGEFPIPVNQSNSNTNNVTIQFKPFGVSVKFLPVVLTDSRIRILVEPEVSELTDEGAIAISGFSIPALNTRRARTTLEMAPGESFMIAGLIQDKMRSQINQLPGISEIPILSALFRSTEFQREETELVLAITPYLVDPMVSSDVKLPTDEFKPASVMESFFYGALGSISDNQERISQTPSLEGPIGFMVD